MNEEIKVNGNFAVRVGNMWAKRDYALSHAQRVK